MILSLIKKMLKSNPLISLSSPTPRWIIFFIDITICMLSIILAYMLRFNFVIPEAHLEALPKVVGFVLIIRVFSFLLFRPYAGIIRYTGIRDAERIIFVTLFGSFVFILSNLTSRYVFAARHVIPYGIVLIDFFITIVSMISYRLLVKSMFEELKKTSRKRSGVLIYGTDHPGIATKNLIEQDPSEDHDVIGFLENQTQKVGKKLEGIPIYHHSRLSSLLQNNSVSMVIFSRKEPDVNIRTEITDLCLQNHIRLLAVPPVDTWVDGELSFKQIKKVFIEDLLERPPINLDTTQIQKTLKGKAVLVTGAAGSIGSEIVRQLTKYSLGKLILFDQAESPLYLIDLELSERYTFSNYEIEIGSITKAPRLKQIMRKYKPDIVFHAAAYKHVPLMESQPFAAIINNVYGTRILADYCMEYGTEKFIMVSTDKAVNPTNVMGASKRLAEIYTQSLNGKSKTAFITTRFGNVLGSNGSVIPRFRKQIENGGPVTITHPEITRFFMTIPEACQLVLEAGSMGRGGEIFVFDMGKSIKITDLAKKMIRLSGLTLGKDIEIKYTGLRPGEKLYEELLTSGENTLPTHHPKILIARVKKYKLEEISEKLNRLFDYELLDDAPRLVTQIKELLPEFVSKNSEFEKLDKIDGELSGPE